MRTVGPFVHKRADILRNNAEDRRLQRTFYVIDGLDAGVEVFDEECQADAHEQTDDNANTDIERFLR